jgi:hypothetical protein
VTEQHPPNGPSEPSELDQIQTFFAEQLRKRRALPKDSALAERARTVVSASGRLSPVERLEIYREQFWLRHTSSLVEDFPGTSGILGQETWQTLIEGYLDAHPPQSYTLRDLGLRLPEYVASQHWLPEHALCCDMARLELAYLEIFDAADAAPLNVAQLAEIPEEAWERAHLVLHPALRLLAVDYPVATLRKQLFQAQTSGEKIPIPPGARQYLVLYRRDLTMFHEQLDAGAYALLGALARRVALVPACVQAQAEMPEEAASIVENVGAWCQAWTASGFITGVEV